MAKQLGLAIGKVEAPQLAVEKASKRSTAGKHTKRPPREDTPPSPPQRDPIKVPGGC